MQFLAIGHQAVDRFEGRADRRMVRGTNCYGCDRQRSKDRAESGFVDTNTDHDADGEPVGDYRTLGPVDQGQIDWLWPARDQDRTDGVAGTVGFWIDGCLPAAQLAGCAPSAPDLTMALVAWIAAAAPMNRSLGRVWLVAMTRDLIDPVTQCGHTLVAIVVVTLLQPLFERWRVYGPAAVPLWGSGSVSC